VINVDRALALFKETGALLEGHFLLTSGLHSNRYFQCAKVLQFPQHCTLLCGDIAAQFRTVPVDAVIAPAMGGIVVGQEVGRQLNVRTMFAERKEGVMQLRRGFAVGAGERVLVCEDVVTTGGSVSEVVRIVRDAGGIIAGIGFVVDRSGGKTRIETGNDCLQYPVLTMDVVTHNPESCPLCKGGLLLVKPGSRGNA